MGGMGSCCTSQQQKTDSRNEETRADSLYSSRVPRALQQFGTRWATGRSVSGQGIDV